MQSMKGYLSNKLLPASICTVQFSCTSTALCTTFEWGVLLLMLQGPVVYGAKVEDRFKASDKVKVLLASATLMNKSEKHMPREQAWNHSVETRIKAGDDDRLAVSTPRYSIAALACAQCSHGIVICILQQYQLRLSLPSILSFT